jgi:AmiR/NasT family two-component response regulator
VRLNLALAFAMSRRERLRALEAERDELKAQVEQMRGLRK